MLKDIVSASPLDGRRLRIRYEDGVEGVVDLGEIVSFRGVFAPLKDPTYFSQVRVDPNSARSCGQMARTSIPMSSTAVWFRTAMNWCLAEGGRAW